MGINSSVALCLLSTGGELVAERREGEQEGEHSPDRSRPLSKVAELDRISLVDRQDEKRSDDPADDAGKDDGGSVTAIHAAGDVGVSSPAASSSRRTW